MQYDTSSSNTYSLYMVRPISPIISDTLLYSTCCQKQKMEIVSLLIITDLKLKMPLKVDELQYILVLGICCQKAFFRVETIY